MSEIQHPVRLPRNAKTSVRYHALKLDLKLNAELVSTASMVVLENEAPEIHDFIEIFTAMGSAGIYRVTSMQHTYGGTVSVEMAHAVDCLSDAIVAVEQDYTGTVENLLTLILQHQKATPGEIGYWYLGTCEDTTVLEDMHINYDNAYDLLEQIAQDEVDYYFTFDTTHPSRWLINFVARPVSALSELRIDRNMIKCEITRDDSELCTRLYVGLTNPNVGSHNVYTYDNTPGQLTYGIVERHIEMEATSRAPANRYAQKYLQEHSAPLYNIEIDGADLYQKTGVLVDRMSLYAQCNVCLGSTFGHREIITQPIVSIEYSDLINNPMRVRVTLASRITTDSQKYKETKKELSIIEKILARK